MKFLLLALAVVRAEEEEGEGEDAPATCDPACGDGECCGTIDGAEGPLKVCNLADSDVYQDDNEEEFPFSCDPEPEGEEEKASGLMLTGATLLTLAYTLA